MSKYSNNSVTIIIYVAQDYVIGTSMRLLVSLFS